MSDTAASKGPAGLRWRSRFSSRLALGLGLLIAVALYFYYDSVVPYSDLTAQTYGHFWPRRGWLWLHVGGGTLALFMGPFQFRAMRRAGASRKRVL